MKKHLLLAAISLIVVLILAFSVVNLVIVPDISNTSSTTQNPNNDIPNPEEGIRDPIDYTNTFFAIDSLFKAYSIFDVDYETAMLAAIQAYVGATGDKHAMFYTDEELEALFAENNGDFYGIGVQVIFDYDEYFMEIVLIFPDSPASEHLTLGDKVTHIVDNGKKVSLADIVAKNKEKVKTLYPTYTDEQINTVAGYEAFQYAVSKLKGPEGTYAQFTVDRNGTSYDMTVKRAKVKTLSVTSKVSIRDSKVGIVSISGFDMTTPVQFKENMDKLIAQGCDKFVFDLRNNPGGDLASVVAVVSTLLNSGDVIFSTKDLNSKINVTKVGVVNYSESSGYSTCSVSKSDIGKYAGYEMVVLVDENSASAAEIFTSSLRDHDKADIVGMNTYGKGSVQSIITLSNVSPSCHGGLKLTTKLYFPPCGVGYDGGIGIAPDYEVELEGEAAKINFYKLTEDIDNQLQKAVSVLID